MRRGEVWWYEAPHEKARPILVLTRDEHIDRQLDVIAVPATRTVRGWDTEIHIGVADSMPAESVLNVGNTFLAKQAYLTQHITALSSVRMTEVCRMLTYATNC
jgi:mRNA-degrading endonuclease toxin of MazEF toxin-antitoxin module